LKLLDEILKNQGRPPTSWAQFKKFFDEYDDNGDGVISRKECAGFIRGFIAGPVGNRPAARDPIEQLVHKLFAKFDTDRSGFLEPRECLKLLDDEASYAIMSRAHNPYGDGKASQRIVDVITKND